MILGIDIGNRVTKTSKMKDFYSTVLSGHKELNSSDIKVVYKGKAYTLGAKEGIPFLGSDRYFTEQYDMCLLTAIALSIPKQVINTKIVVSMPPDRFKSDLKVQLKERLNRLGLQSINVNGEEKSISIEAAIVFCEDSVVYSDTTKYKGNKHIFIDIGGGTADISEFGSDLKLVFHTTEPLGLLSLYEDMKQAVNSTFNTKFSAHDMEDMINKDYYEIKQEDRNISFLKTIVQDHVNKIKNVVEQNCGYQNAKMHLIGGGAEPLLQYFKDEYKKIDIVEFPQHINAITNEKVGEAYFNE